METCCHEGNMLSMLASVPRGAPVPRSGRATRVVGSGVSSPARPAALTLGEPAPDAVPLRLGRRCLPALPGDGAAQTDVLGHLLAGAQRSPTAFGVEEVGVHASACGVSAPRVGCVE